MFGLGLGLVLVLGLTTDQPAGQMGGQDEPRVFTSDQPAAQMRARSEAGACVVKSGCVRGQKRVRAW